VTRIDVLLLSALTICLWTAAPVIGRAHAAQEAKRTPQQLPFRSVRPDRRTLPVRTAADRTGPSAKKPSSATRLPKPASSAKGSPARPVSGFRALTTVGASLGIVIGAFLLLVWGLKRTNPKSSQLLPDEVLEVLGRKPMGGRVGLQLLRLGNKLILVAVTAEGAETLAEITDASQVDHLAGLCRQRHPSSITQSFQEILGSQPRTGRRSRKKA